MNIRTVKIIALIAFVSGSLVAQDAVHNYKPTSGYVPNAETAIRIAVAVWEPIYGTKQIASEKPYHATLKDGIWLVEGSLPSGRLGGVAIAEISKSEATVLRVSHGK